MVLKAELRKPFKNMWFPRIVFHRRKMLIHRFTKVEETNQREDGTWDVVTNKGTIHAEVVVNAAGLWGREAPPAGVQLDDEPSGE